MNPWLCISADDYDDHMSHPDVRQRAFLDRIFAHGLDRYQPTTVALIGCATGGGLDCSAVQRVQRLLALDLNAEFVAITRSRHAHRLPQLEVIEGDIATVELGEKAFELIHCALVLEYVAPSTALSRMARALVPDGVLIVVLQLRSSEASPVTQTGRESLNRLRPLMQLHDPQEIEQLALQIGLRMTHTHTHELQTGRQFYVGEFVREAETDGPEL